MILVCEGIEVIKVSGQLWQQKKMEWNRMENTWEGHDQKEGETVIEVHTCNEHTKGTDTVYIAVIRIRFVKNCYYRLFL